MPDLGGHYQGGQTVGVCLFFQWHAHAGSPTVTFSLSS